MENKSQFPLIIAIDGPAASGKGTIARLLAEKLNLACLDTGKLYRAVAWQALQQGIFENHDKLVATAKHLDVLRLDDSALQSDEVAQKASIVAAIPAIRQALYDMQRDFAFHPQNYSKKKVKGAVLDGRDIGTVIIPETPFKFFVMASPEVRAKRRYKDLIKGGHQTTFDAVLADIVQRDRRDRERTISPLKVASDAIIIDTTDQTVDKTLEIVLHYLKERYSHSR